MRVSAARRERMRQLNADPEFKAKHSAAARERMRQLHADPEFKAKHSERMRQLHADPEFKAKQAGLVDIKIPAWCPLSLWGEFIDVAKEQGEFAACAHIRKLKREMERGASE